MISLLAERGGTPPFSPHITLLGQLPQDVEWIKARLADFTKDLEPFKLSLSHIEMVDQYFRSIIMHTHAHPGLHRLYTRALQQFEVAGNDVFVPHLSLLYSHHEESRKRQLLEDIVVRSSTQILSIKELLLVNTSGSPQQWRDVMRIRLG